MMRQPEGVKHLILLVANDPEVREALVKILTLDGYVVDSAENGASAITKLRQQTYGVILSDIRMLNGDGLTLYEAIKQQHSELLERLIFITGETLRKATQEFLEHIRGPCVQELLSLGELRQVIQQVLHTGAEV